MATHNWQLIVSFTIIFVINVVAIENSTALTNNATTIKRSKRYLDFLPLSRMFVSKNQILIAGFLYFNLVIVFLQFRANIKDNVIQSYQFWAQSYGYRANFPIENRRRVRRSEVYDTLEELITKFVFRVFFFDELRD